MSENIDRILRSLIRELKSPVGDSEAELLSDVDEVIEVLQGLSHESPPKLKMILNDAINSLSGASSGDGRKIASVIGRVLELVEVDEIEAPGLILRLQTLLRRSLPISGDYDTPQSHLQPPFDPTKSGRYITSSKL